MRPDRANSNVFEWNSPAVLLPRQRSKLARGANDKEHAMSQTPHRNCRSRHRYRQELVPRCWPRSARHNCAASEVVTWPGGSTLCQHVTVPDRHGGLRWRASPQPQAQDAWSRCSADAGEVCEALLEFACPLASKIREILAGPVCVFTLLPVPLQQFTNAR